MSQLFKPNYQLPTNLWPSLISTIQNSKKPDIIKRRDQAILEILYGSGLKVSELIQLQTNHIISNGNNHYIRLRPRTVPLTHQATYAIKKYLKLRNNDSTTLFIRQDNASGNKHQSLTARSVERMVEYYCKLAKINIKITPSDWRHIFAQKLLNQGISITELQKILGHSNLTTTKLLYKN